MNFQHNRKGFSLMEVVIAIGILGIFLTLGMNVSSRLINETKINKNKGELLDLERYVRNNLSCEQMIKRVNSTSCKTMPVLDKEGAMVVDPRRPIGKSKFSVNTECQDHGDYYEFRPNYKAASAESFEPLYGNEEGILCSKNSSSSCKEIEFSLPYGCISTRHGGSLSASNTMNRRSGYATDCSVNIPLANYIDRDLLDSATGMVISTTRYGAATGSTFADGFSRQYGPEYGNDVTTLTPPGALSDRISFDVYQQNSLGNVGSKTAVWYGQVNRSSWNLNFRYYRDGWGSCRWSHRCYSYLNDIKVKLTCS